MHFLYPLSLSQTNLAKIFYFWNMFFHSTPIVCADSIDSGPAKSDSSSSSSASTVVNQPMECSYTNLLPTADASAPVVASLNNGTPKLLIVMEFLLFYILLKPFLVVGFCWPFCCRFFANLRFFLAFNLLIGFDWFDWT